MTSFIMYEGIIGTIVGIIIFIAALTVLGNLSGCASSQNIQQNELISFARLLQDAPATQDMTPTQSEVALFSGTTLIAFPKQTENIQGIGCLNQNCDEKVQITAQRPGSCLVDQSCLCLSEEIGGQTARQLNGRSLTLLEFRCPYTYDFDFFTPNDQHFVIVYPEEEETRQSIEFIKTKKDEQELVFLCEDINVCTAQANVQAEEQLIPSGTYFIYNAEDGEYLDEFNIPIHPWRRTLVVTEITPSPFGDRMYSLFETDELMDPLTQEYTNENIRPLKTLTQTALINELLKYTTSNEQFVCVADDQCTNQTLPEVLT